MAIPYFLKKEGDSLIFNLGDDSYLQFFVPETYFTTKDALIIGEYVNLLGILDYTIYDKNGNNKGLKPFRFPTVFLTIPGKIEKVKDIQLTKYSKRQDYRLLKYYKGDIVVHSTKVPQDIVNVEDFYNLFTTGKLPTTIKYNELHEYFNESINLNGGDYGVSSQLFGIIVSEMCRDPKDPTKPFRLTKMEDMTAYSAVNIKTLPKFVSPYTSITSENWDEAVVNAVILKERKNSPLEKILTE